MAQPPRTLPKPDFREGLPKQSIKIVAPGLVGNVWTTFTIVHHEKSGVMSKSSSKFMVQMWNGSTPLYILNDRVVKERSPIVVGQGMSLRPDKYFISTYVSLKTPFLVRKDDISMKLEIQDHTLSSSKGISIPKGIPRDARLGTVGLHQEIFYHIDLEDGEDSTVLVKGYEFALRKDTVFVKSTGIQKPLKLSLMMGPPQVEDIEEFGEDEPITPLKGAIDECVICGEYAPYECYCGTVAFCGDMHRNICWKTHKSKCTWGSKQRIKSLIN